MHLKKTVSRCSVILLFAVAAIVLYMYYGIDMNHFNYAMSLRIPKVLAIIIGGVCIASTTVIFQTITHNRILTPGVLGLDSMYVLIQTVIVFTLGSTSTLIVNKNINFIINTVIMIIASMLIYNIMFKRNKREIYFVVLSGMIFGTLFKSGTSFMHMVIDPNEYLALESSMIAGLNNINVDVVLISIVLLVAIVPFVYDDIKYLDVVSLGRENAINLGVDYDRIVRKMFLVIGIMISISTALIGPLTFLGLIVSNIAREVLKTYRHGYMIAGAIFISICMLAGGQFMVQHIFVFETTLATILNFVGGIYFIYILMKEKAL